MKSTTATDRAPVKRSAFGVSVVGALLICGLLLQIGRGQDGATDRASDEGARPPCPDLPLQLQSGVANPVFPAAVRWVCLDGAPSCDNPAIVGQEHVRDVLFERQRFASDCVWVKQGKVLLRSGGAAQQPRIVTLADPDPQTGQGGDLVVDPPSELMAAFSAADAAWSPVMQGALALSANRLINAAGQPVADAVVVEGVATMPWMALADPSRTGRGDGRLVAHAMGHLFSLSHGGGGEDLMNNGGGGVRLNAEQSSDARSYLDDRPSLLVEPPVGSGPVFLDRALDPWSDAVAGVDDLDITSCVVVDRAASRGRVQFLIGLAGLIPETGPEGETDPVYLALALNRDNDAQTGDNANLVVPDMDLPGTDFLIEVFVDRRSGQAIAGVKFATGRGLFLDVELLAGLLDAQSVIGHLQYCSPTPALDGPSTVPFVTEVRIDISKDLIAPELSRRAGGGVQRAFPRGVLFQVATALGSGRASIDRCPNVPAVLRFAGVDFPVITHRRSVSRGDRLDVSVARMPARAPLVATAGSFDADSQPGVTDDDGNGVLALRVPENAPTGLTSLTVEVDDGVTALTAGGVVRVTPCPPDLNEDGQLNVFDFLTFQNFWQQGVEPADYDGDGETTILDFMAYQNDFEQGCP